MDNSNQGAVEGGAEKVPASSWYLVAISWTLVGMPHGWGIWKTLEKAAVLFR
jgi:hypothetical protein